MMTNLFSMFDPSSSYYSMLWMAMVFPMTMYTLKMYKTSNKKNLSIKLVLSNILQGTKKTMGKKDKKYSSLTLNNKFFVIMTMNMMSLIPYNFTTMAHTTITFSLSLTLWVSILIFGFWSSFKSMVAHMTPMGTPMSLMNFMVLIETVSNLIRPITLAVRLSANMVAGHLMMTLLSELSIEMMYWNIPMAPLMATLISLEMTVALIQAYVFTTLLTLYYNESL